MKTHKQDNLTIHNADCMEVMSQYEDNYFDLAVVDPPYGIGASKKPISAGKFKRDIHKSKDWDDNIPNENYFDELKRVSKNQIIWGGNYFLDFLGATPCFIVWDKKLENGWLADCELAWTSFNTQVKKFTRHHIQDHNAGVIKIHPTQKSTDLYSFIYKNYAQEGQKILDTHLGSGSNAISAHYAKMGEFVGCELDEDYYKASIERIYKETRQQELF